MTLNVSSLNTHTFIISISVSGIESWIIWILSFKTLHWAGTILISGITGKTLLPRALVWLLAECASLRSIGLGHQWLTSYWLEDSLGPLPYGPLHIASQVKPSNQERKRGYLQKNNTEVTIIWNLIELTSCHIYCILFVRSKSEKPSPLPRRGDYAKMWTPGDGDHWRLVWNLLTIVQ